MKIYIIGPILADVGHGILSVFLASILFGVQPTLPLFLLGIISAFLPDLDSIPELLKRGKVAAHKDNARDHRDGLHYPIIWLIILIVFYGFYPYLFTIISISVLLHFINDSWGTGWGVMWLWPFSHRSYKFFSRNDLDADVRASSFVVSWSPEEKMKAIIEKGNPNWQKDYYGTINKISIIEYGTFIVAVVLLLIYYF